MTKKQRAEFYKLRTTLKLYGSTVIGNVAFKPVTVVCLNMVDMIVVWDGVIVAIGHANLGQGISYGGQFPPSEQLNMECAVKMALPGFKIRKAIRMEGVRLMTWEGKEIFAKGGK